MQEKRNSRDSLFDVEQISEDFIFNERVARVFDDMLDRSVPFYHEVILAIARIFRSTLKDGDSIVDLGCATGATLLKLSSLLEEKDFHYTGIDNSQAMLDQARLKAELFSKQDRLKFINEDITEVEQPNTSAFILNYTLQFIRPLYRESFLKQIYANLVPGGICILSEKQSPTTRDSIEVTSTFTTSSRKNADTPNLKLQENGKLWKMC